MKRHTVFLLLCAWVLWRNDAEPIASKPGWVTSNYSILEAFTGMGPGMMHEALTQKKCEDRKAQLVMTVRGKEKTEYLCLPDTVDPRGPK